MSYFATFSRNEFWQNKELLREMPYYMKYRGIYFVVALISQNFVEIILFRKIYPIVLRKYIYLSQNYVEYILWRINFCWKNHKKRINQFLSRNNLYISNSFILWQIKFSFWKCCGHEYLLLRLVDLLLICFINVKICYEYILSGLGIISKSFLWGITN